MCLERIERRLGGAPMRWLLGSDHDLLHPFAWVEPGLVPSLPARPRACRERLADLLERSNREWGHPRASELAARLRNPETRVVVTGQQCGLFGGPLLVLTKLLAAVRWAEVLTLSGQPAVALFWMASEDHDFAEVASARFVVGLKTEELSLGPDPLPLVPVGARELGSEADELFQRLEAWYPSERFQRWIQQLRQWWRPGSRFPDAFARQWIAVLGARAPLFIEPLSVEFKRWAVPVVVSWAKDPEATEQALRDRTRALEERGFAPQVHLETGAQPFFWLDEEGRRRRVLRTPQGSWALRGVGEVGSWASLLERMVQEPERISPAALGRPAYGDAVLGTALHVLGPGELSYFAQAAVLYPVAGVSPPAVVLRPELLLMDRRNREALAGLGGGLSDVLKDPDQWRHTVASRAGGLFLEPGRRQILEVMAGWAAPTLALDPSLLRPYERTRETVERALCQFARRVEAAGLRRDRIRQERVERLLANLWPGGQPQERGLAAAYWLGRFGAAWVANLLDDLSLDPRWVTVVELGAEGEAAGEPSELGAERGEASVEGVSHEA